MSLVVQSNGGESSKDLIRAELSTNLAGNWHYLTIRRTKNTLSVKLDDGLNEEISVPDLSDDFSTSNEVLLHFGRYSYPENYHFIGCIGMQINACILLLCDDNVF